jgi:hypothetical protein
MAYLLSIAMFLPLLTPQKQTLSDALYELPQQVREQATLIVTGTYAEGRTPCLFMPDGTRRWAMESSIRIKKAYRGEAGGKYIYLDWGMLLKTKMKLMQGHTYLVALRPNSRSMNAIRKGECLPFWESLDDEEIIAIVELK